MREFDEYGLKICSYQGRLFQESLTMTRCSSPIFLRRFMYSDLAVRMDKDGFLFEALDITDAFEELDKQYGESGYGQIRYDPEEMYWLGYLYRYWAYTYECNTKKLYKIIKPVELIKLYYPYHSLDPAQAIERILEPESIIQEDLIEKGVKVLRRKRRAVNTITVVSLSSGVLGEESVKHELELGVRRLEAKDIKVKFAEHALKGRNYLKEHPEVRAKDLIEAFLDPATDMILCAIGGDDTYRLLPYLFEHGELEGVAEDKIFLGFSDSTINHFMLHKVGIKTFYGQAFLPDICELDRDMLPFTQSYFSELVLTGEIHEIRPSSVWYEERSDFSKNAVGTSRKQHKNKGFELLQGPEIFSGEILGGCIDSIFDMFDNERYEDSVKLCSKYKLFPDLKAWEGKILLLETSEEQPSPEKFKKMLNALKNTGVFTAVNGILVGKPMDEKYNKEYQRILLEVVDDVSVPVLWNLNVGHATPRCIVPFGKMAYVDAKNQVIRFD